MLRYVTLKTTFLSLSLFPEQRLRPDSSLGKRKRQEAEENMNQQKKEERKRKQLCKKLLRGKNKAVEKRERLGRIVKQSQHFSQSNIKTMYCYDPAAFPAQLLSYNKMRSRVISTQRYIYVHKTHTWQVPQYP
jgi:hypothetical protein